MVFIRSPSQGAWNYPIFLSRRFHRPIYFQLEFTANSDTHRNSVTNHIQGANFLTDFISSLEDWKKKKTNAIFSSPMRAHADGNSHISREKRSKNRPGCNWMPWQTEYGSCTLLVMGSCFYVLCFSGNVLRCLQTTLLCWCLQWCFLVCSSFNLLAWPFWWLTTTNSPPATQQWV